MTFQTNFLGQGGFFVVFSQYLYLEVANGQKIFFSNFDLYIIYYAFQAFQKDVNNDLVQFSGERTPN